MDFGDGVVGYRYEWIFEDTTEDGSALLWKETLLVCSDGFMSCDTEYYWESGDWRTIEFYGFYDTFGYEGLEGFNFEFRYEWSDGSYYTVGSDEINYSENLALTLNQHDANFYNCRSLQAHIDCAKEQFNLIYEWLTEDMARFE